MADSRPWLGEHTFPRIWIYLCYLINLASIVALIILIVAEFLIISNNYANYVARYGYRYRMSTAPTLA